MAEVYGNVNVKYNPCKSIAQLKSAADYILGKRKEQIEEGIEKTSNELYNSFGCNRDNFANSLIITRKMHQKKYSRYKPKEILAQKISISIHPEDSNKLSYREAYIMAEQFAKEFFWSKSVTKIGDSAFSRCSNAVDVTLTSSIEELGTGVFGGCTKIENVYWNGTTDEWLTLSFSSKSSSPLNGGANLYANDVLVTEINVGESITAINSYALYGCESIENIIFPDTMTTIGESAFSGCSNLTKVQFPETLTSIGNTAFSGCKSLTEIYFTGDVPEIAEKAFSGVTATCYYPSDNSTYTSDIKNSGYGGTLTWTYDGEDELVLKFQCGDNITAILKENVLTIEGSGAMYDYKTDGTNYAPWYEYRNTVTSVEIGEGVTSIGDAAFYSCIVMTDVTMPDTVTSIGNYAFDSCAITSIELSKGLTSIGEYAFEKTKLESITIPEGVTTVGTNAFYNSSILSAVLPDTLTYIPEKMFYACKYLQDVDLPKTFTSIGNYAFASCYGLKGMTLPEGLVSIGKGAFSSCGSYTGAYGGSYPCSNFTSIELPSTLESIGNDAFWYCQLLKSIVIPDKVKSIERQTFGNCSALNNVTISANIESIAADVFLNCNSIKKVTFKWNMPTIDLNAFSRKVTATCYYPSNNPDWDVTIFSEHNGTLTWVGQEMEKPSEGTGGGSGGGDGEEEGDDSGTTGGNTGDSDKDEDSGTTGGNTGGNTGGTTGGNTGSGETPGGNAGNQEGTGGEGSGTGSGGSGTYTFEITSQPKDYLGALNDTVAFSLTATGEELKYEWFYSKDGGETFVKTWSDGYNTNTLSPILRAHRDGQKFYCVVTDKYGNSLESDIVTMAVESSDVTIAKQPVTIENGVLGTLYHFTVEAEGVNLAYRWYCSKDNGETWQESWIDGYNTNTLNIRMNANRSGWIFRCVVTSGLKIDAVSEEVLFQLQEPSVELISSPEDVVADIGQTVSFSVNATGNDLTYRWYYSTDKTNWTETWLDGYNTPTLKFTCNANRAGKYYRCIVKDGSGKTVASTAAALTLALPEIVTQHDL